MTWYRKPKHAPQVDNPLPCFQCGRRDDTTLISIVGASPGEGRSSVWLCPTCREKLPPDPSRN